MFLSEVRFLNGGYCRQFEYFTGLRSWKIRRFQAVFIHFRHPIHGECLIDTGYGPEYYRQTRRWPWRLMNWIIPVPAQQPFGQPEYLSQQSLSSEKIRIVFVSHFHADHIGGLRRFPQSQFVYRSQSHEKLLRLATISQLQHGFIPELLPDDFVARGLPIEEKAFDKSNTRFTPISSYDYFGDGSLILLDLPGHALGHTGYILRTSDREYLYVVDAFWSYEAFRQKLRLPMLARRTVYDRLAYDGTLEKLREISERLGCQPMACHCPMTQKWISTNAH